MSDIIRGSVTNLDGRLLLGDQILSINGEDVCAATQEHVQQLLQVRQIHNIINFDRLSFYLAVSLHMCSFSLKNCSGEVYLEVARFKAGLQYSQQSQVNEVMTDD